MKRLTAVLVSCLSVSLFAASPHYKKNGQPLCTAEQTGNTFVGGCTAGLVAGLGNEDLTFGVIATASAGTFCHSPGSGNVAPGQNPAEAQFASLQTIPGSAIKNGNATLSPVSFSFELAVPTPEQAGCANSNWSVSLGPVEWSATYVVYQPFPELLEKLSFDF